MMKEVRRFLLNVEKSGVISHFPIELTKCSVIFSGRFFVVREILAPRSVRFLWRHKTWQVRAVLSETSVRRDDFVYCSISYCAVVVPN